MNSRAPQRKWRVLVVDDEPPARRTIKTLLAACGRVEVVGECDHADAAVAAIRELRPDLLFIDVQMPGASGLDVLHAAGLGVVPIVVFTTAFSEYAVDAFQAQAFDYLLKPFSDERFGQVLTRVLAALERARPAELIAVPRTVTVRDAGRTLVIPVSEIDWIEAEDYCTRIHAGVRKPLVRRSMRSLLDELEADAFIRTHRSAIVNLARVRELRSLPSGEAELLLASGEKVRVSRAQRPLLEVRLRERT
ncbi:MAG TPA: LytTR family DNA-binding domain-containing protein [Vicinamibacterales bacterium]|nr:LytTR family DNA-binding domain-containing protein [Vicinamibacterales bacterium]